MDGGTSIRSRQPMIKKFNEVRLFTECALNGYRERGIGMAGNYEKSNTSLPYYGKSSGSRHMVTPLVCVFLSRIPVYLSSCSPLVLEDLESI